MLLFKILTCPFLLKKVQKHIVPWRLVGFGAQIKRYDSVRNECFTNYCLGIIQDFENTLDRAVWCGRLRYVPYR
jgi:hypothetical protein